MTQEYEARLEPRRQHAIRELTSLVSKRYPTASFDIGPGDDDLDATHIIATVDIDDPDEVVDLIIDRMLAIQIDEGIPVHLIPIRTPERTAAVQKQRTHRRPVALQPPAHL